MIEALLRPVLSQSRFRFFVVGALYALVAGVVSFIVFKPFASVAMVFFAAIACIPYIQSLIEKEEESVFKFMSELSFIKEYSHVASALISLFFGLTAGFLVIGLAFPSLHGSLFSVQESTLVAISGHAVEGGAVQQILLANAIVLLICLVLSLIFTFGSIVIITWNASVIAFALVKFITINAAEASTLGAFTIGFARFFLHGIPEVLGFLLVGVAGGIVSVAVTHHDVGTKKWGVVMKDALQLFIISACLILIGALIEVFVTPILY